MFFSLRTFALLDCRWILFWANGLSLSVLTRLVVVKLGTDGRQCLKMLWGLGNFSGRRAGVNSDIVCRRIWQTPDERFSVIINPNAGVIYRVRFAK